MNVFCLIFGHTWVHKSESPKTSWNVDKSGQLLEPHPSGDVVFYEECARCLERRNERRIPTAPAVEPGADDAGEAAASA